MNKQIICVIDEHEKNEHLKLSKLESALVILGESINSDFLALDSKKYLASLIKPDLQSFQAESTNWWNKIIAKYSIQSYTNQRLYVDTISKEIYF